MLRYISLAQSDLCDACDSSLLPWSGPWFDSGRCCAQETSKLPNALSTPAPPLIRFNAEFGVEAPFFSSGDRWTKFVQYRDIPSNFDFSSLDFSIGQENSRWSLNGLALDAGQLDQRYRLLLEKFGVSHTTVRFLSWFLLLPFLG